jgi:ComF family protein
LSRPVADCPARHLGWCVDEVRAPFLYAPPLTRFLHALKYRQKRSFGVALGELLRDELVADSADCDAIVVVPLHAARLRQRTFNQADEIARPLARGLGRPLLMRGLGRALDTPPQTSLRKHERLGNPAHAFVVSRDLSGLAIAIVDDVITTGATVNALAAALKAAGAARVAAFAVARAI